MSTLLWNLGLLLLAWSLAAVTFNPWLENRFWRLVAGGLFCGGSLLIAIGASL